MDADTGAVLKKLSNGDKLDLAALSAQHFNIVAAATTSVGSVVFHYDDLNVITYERPARLAASTNLGLTDTCWTPTVGTHTLSATPFQPPWTDPGQSITFTVTSVPSASTCPAAPPVPGGGDGGTDGGPGGGTPTPTPTPTPGPTPTPTPVPPTSGNVVFNGDFETGGLNQWSNVQDVASNRYAVVSGSARQGQYAARVEIDGGDPLVATGQRSEVMWGGDSHPTLTSGSDYYFGWSTKFASDFPSPTNGGHCLFIQWKNVGTGSPPLDLECRNERIQISYDGACNGWNIPLIRGGWNDFVVHVKFSSDPSVGFIEIWHKGPNDATLTKKLNHCSMATLDPGSASYLKLGYYRRNDEQRTGVLWQDGMRVGTTFDAVDPTGSATPGSPGTSPTPPSSTSITKVMYLVEENHSLDEMRTQMPWLFALAGTYGYATSYTAATHPSLPNYLAIAGGSTYGIHDDNDPSAHPLTGASIFDQAIAAGKTAKVYMESMAGNCQMTASGQYVVKHNPWPYFADPASRANCKAFDVPLGTPSAGALHDDIAAGRIPNVSMVVPNMVNDAHDGSLGQADAWLSGWLPQLMSSADFQAGRLLIVVTADEDDSTQGNRVLTVVLHPAVSGSVVASPLNHYSLTRLAAEVIGGAPLGGGASSPSLMSAFGLNSQVSVAASLRYAKRLAAKQSAKKHAKKRARKHRKATARRHRSTRRHHIAERQQTRATRR